MVTMAAVRIFAIVNRVNITASARAVGNLMGIESANPKLVESELLVALNLWQSTSTNASSMVKGTRI